MGGKSSVLLDINLEVTMKVLWVDMINKQLKSIPLKTIGSRFHEISLPNAFDGEFGAILTTIQQLSSKVSAFNSYIVLSD
ncbi:hypothetical protein TNCV_1322921 [Trichonephila clavipes]|nr:hypothetical protein TNCV_1322921 [Trichonephila clavipes]